MTVETSRAKKQQLNQLDQIRSGMCRWYYTCKMHTMIPTQTHTHVKSVAVQIFGVSLLYDAMQH